jgi:hypothetical protein
MSGCGDLCQIHAHSDRDKVVDTHVDIFCMRWRKLLLDCSIPSAQALLQVAENYP